VTVAVSEPALCQEFSALLQIQDHIAISFFDVLADVSLSGIGCIPSVLPHWAEDLQALLQSKLVILQTVAWCNVHAAGVLRSDEVCSIDSMLDAFLSWHKILQGMGVFQLLHLFCA